MTICDLFLRVMLTLTLLPLRLLGMAIVLLGIIWPCAYLMVFGQDMEEPSSGFRRFAMLYLYAPFIRLLYFIAGVVWIRTTGSPAGVEEAPIIVTAPHSSFLDPILVWLATSAPAIVTKNDVLDIPVIGKIISTSQPVWIDRFNPDARRLAVEDIKARARSNGRWFQLMLFPEGTTSSGQALITFKPGAFLPGVPVQPVVLKLPDYVVWTWDSPGAMYICWRIWTSLWTIPEVEFLPVYVPSAAEKADANLYAENVRKFMAQRAGLETSQLGFEDCRLIQAVKHLGLPSEVGTIDVVRTSKILDISTETILHELKHFALEATKNAKGRITLTSFGDLIHVPMETPGASGLCAEAFLAFEKGQTGLMSFKEYLAFISLAKKIGDDSDIVKIAQLIGEEEEPYNYDDLTAATKVVAWRRRLESSKIGAAAEKLKDEVRAFKGRRSDGTNLRDALSKDQNVNRIMKL